MKERYHVTGMSCSACSSHVEKAVNKLENVEKASVNLLTETMDVTYDETKITSTEIIDAVVKAGYGASVMTEGSAAGAGGQSTSGNAFGFCGHDVIIVAVRTFFRQFFGTSHRQFHIGKENKCSDFQLIGNAAAFQLPGQSGNL